MNAPLTLVLLPERSTVREKVARALTGRAVDWVPLTEIARATHAVIDLTCPGGAEALQHLRATPSGHSMPVVVVLDPAATRAIPVESIDAEAFVSVGQIEEELAWRLEHAQTRHLAGREAAERQRDLSLLLELTGRYTEALDAQMLLYDVTRRLAEAMDIPRASMVMIDETHTYGYVVAASDDATLKDLKIELARYPEIRETVRTNKPVIVEDAPSHPLLEGVKTEVAARGYRTIACLPLAVGGKVLGVLLVRAGAHRKAFSMREIDFLATVAHATAVALRNAKLLEHVRGQTELEKSARIAAEQRVENLERYEDYFANISDGIAILDGDAVILTLNPAALALLDVTLEEARNKHINAITQPTDEAVMLDVLLSVSHGEIRSEVDLDVRTAKGRRLTLSLAGAPLHEGGAAVILSMRDVTLTRQMAEELRQTKEFLERLIDSSVDAIIAADMDGKLILFNQGAEAITGYGAEEALMKLNARDLYPAGVAQSLMKKLRSGEHGGKGRLSVAREELMTKRGERVPVNMTASILYEGEREVATVGILTDLRDRVQLERKLSDAEIRAEESERNAVIVALAGTAAHELNQPLTSVMGYAELLKRRLKEGEYAYRPVDIIYREAERMAEIVRKIGKITRYETQDYVGTQKILDLDKASSHEE